VGEFELIARLAGALGEAGPGVTLGIGDDAALLAPDLVVSTDLVVEDVHFRRATTGLGDLGWKALAVAMSDLAAMGAAPVGAVVGLALGEGWTEDDAVAVYEGLGECARECGCPVVGGDVSRAATLVLAVTVFGRAAVPATRAGARVGDVLAVTGSLGGSEAGRLLLEVGAEESAAAAALAHRHRRPVPRVADGRLLASYVHAMLDVSDGVASDARRMADASGVCVEVDLDALPIQPGVEEVAAARGVEPGAFAATGGEDYELLVALPEAALASSSVPLTRIGRILEGPAEVRFTGAGADPALAGFDHLRR
jgi:thiamine-monophosphate kinase